MDHRLPVLMGRRLLLREPTAADAEHLFTFTRDPEITRYLSFDPPRMIDDTLAFIVRCEEYRRQDREYVFVLADRASDAARGITALRDIDYGTKTAQIGTWVCRGDWGRGINREAKALVLDYAFKELGLHRIEARVAVENHRSRAALERIGARQEGVLRESLCKQGRYLDQALYAILAGEWDERGGGTAILDALPPDGA